MHVGSLMLFELPEGYTGDYYEDVKALIGKRMHLCGLLHRKLAQMPFELAEPVWIEDDDVDLDYHVRSLTLRRPGTMSSCEVLVSTPALVPARPQPPAVGGGRHRRAGGRPQVAYYTKAHHSGVDGKAGLRDGQGVLRHLAHGARGAATAARGRPAAATSSVSPSCCRRRCRTRRKQYLKLGKLVPTAVKALGAAGKDRRQRKHAEGERSLNLGMAPKTIFNESRSPTSARSAPVAAAGRHQGARQARRRHRQHRGDGDVQQRAAALPEGPRPAAQEVADRDGAGQPAQQPTTSST
jgi:diacylglycerol O-acyltransferase